MTTSSAMCKQKIIGALFILLPVLYCVILGYSEITRPEKLTEGMPMADVPLSELIFPMILTLCYVYLPPVIAGMALVFLPINKLLAFLAAFAILIFMVTSSAVAIMMELMRPSSFLFLRIGTLYFIIGPVLGIIMLVALLHLNKTKAILMGFFLPIVAFVLYSLIR